MNSLPLLSDSGLLQTRWKSILDPILKIPFLDGIMLEGITLDSMTPKAIPTLLNRKQQGWIITDIMSDAKVWRTEAFNDLTLTLESDVDTTISIWVY